MDIHSPTLGNIDFGFWILQTIAMLLTCFLLPKLEVSGPLPALLTVIVMALVNTHFWDAALFFQIPDNLTVQTIALVLTNAVIFFVIVKLLPGIEISGIFPAIAAPILFTITSSLLREHASNVDWFALLEQGTDWLKGFRQNFQQASIQ